MPTHRFRTIAKASTTVRGYGNEHAKARKAAAAQHHPSDPCSICQQPLGPMGPHLHYDHTPTRDGYRGFAHAACNKRDGARRGNLRQRARKATVRPVRRFDRW